MKRPACILFILVSLIAGLSLFQGTAQAGSGIRDIRNTCTTLNCIATIIRGTYQSNGFGDAEPFILQILSSGAECVRLDMLTQGVDLQIVLISPSGRIWANDDRTPPGDTRPLVRAITDVQGWYTLHVSSFDGGIIDADFALSYGRYNPANVNCSPPTPFFSPEASLKPEAQQ